MAVTNSERVGKALDLLRQGLTPFVEREMKAAHGEGWPAIALDSFRDTHSHVDGSRDLDAQALLVLMPRSTTCARGWLDGLGWAQACMKGGAWWSRFTA